MMMKIRTYTIKVVYAKFIYEIKFFLYPPRIPKKRKLSAEEGWKLSFDLYQLNMYMELGKKFKKKFKKKSHI